MDVANLGIKITSDDATIAAQRLEAMASAGEQSERRLTTSSARVTDAITKQGEAVQREAVVAESSARAHQVLETQLATLTQITQGWASAGEQARDIAASLAAEIEKGGRMAQASAQQQQALADAQKVISGASDQVAASAKQVTDSTRAMTLAQIEAIQTNQGLTTSSGSVMDSYRRMALLQVQAADADNRRSAELKNLSFAMLQGESVTERQAAGLRTLIGYEQAAYAEDETRSAGIRRLALAQQQALAIEAERNNAASGGVSKIAKLTEAYDNSNGGIGRLRQGMVSLVSQMTGTNAVVDRTVTTLGGFALGNTLVLGIVAGVAAIGYAYEKLTASAHEAAKAADEFAKTQEGRVASATSLGIVASARVSAGSSLPAGGLDIPALSDEAKKAGDAVRGLQNDLKGLDVGGGAGSTIAGGPTKDVRDLIHELELGQVDATGLAAALSNMSHGAAFFDPLISKVADFGGRLLAATERYDRLTNTIQQATAQQNYYTLSLQASTVNEGKLFEKTQDLRNVLAALQLGGAVAGNRASDQNAALEIAQQLYENAATGGKHAELATVAFRDALKNTASVAHQAAAQFYDDAQKNVAAQRAISDTQKQQATGIGDTTKLTAITDQIERFGKEIGEVGKDASIDNRVRAMDDALSQLETTMLNQVATGKKTQASFDQDAAAIEGARQALYGYGQDARTAASDQLTKQLDGQTAASKSLYAALIDQSGGYHELTAATKAQLEIDRQALLIGNDLTEEQQQAIRDNAARGAAIEEAKGTEAIRAHAVAVRAEIDAIKSGESTRATYAADLKYRTDLAAAALITDQKIHDARVKAIEDDHNASTALDTLKASLASQTTEAQRFERELQSINKALEQDLLHGIEQFASKGITSFRSFFSEVDSMALRMVGQLDSSIKKLSDQWATVFAAGGDTSKLDAELGKLEQFRQIAAGVGAAVTGGTLGFNIGEQTNNAGLGFAGGAAGGALTGSELGPWGAVIGGLAGAAGGLLGAADAHQKAAQAIQDATKQLDLAVNQYGAMTSVESALTQNDIQYGQLHTQALDTIDKTAQSKDQGPQWMAYNALQKLDIEHAENATRIVKDFFDSITQQINATQGSAGAYANSLGAIKKQHDDEIASVNALAAAGKISGASAGFARDQIDALAEAQRKAAQAEYEEGQRQLKFSLDAREANAKGETTLNALLTRHAQEDAERFQAEKDGWSEADKARLVYIQSLEDEATALQRLTDAQQTLAQATAAGPTGTLRSQQAADIQPLFDKQKRDQMDYDSSHQRLLDQLDADTKQYNTDLAAQADKETRDADAARIAADNLALQTQETIKLGDAAAIAAKQFSDAIALVNQAVSDIQRDVSLGFVKDKAGLAAEEKALFPDFTGTIDDLRNLYKPYEGTPLTNEQEETNRRIQQFLGDYDRVNGTKNGLQIDQAGANAPGTTPPVTGNPATEAVTYAAKNLTEATGNRMSEYLASILVVEREQLKALTGGAVNIPPSYTVNHFNNASTQLPPADFGRDSLGVLSQIRELEQAQLRFFDHLSSTPLPSYGGSAPTATAPSIGASALDLLFSSRAAQAPGSSTSRLSGPTTITIAPTVNIHLDKDATVDERAFAQRIVDLVVKEVDEKLAAAYSDQQIVLGNTRVDV